MAGQVGTADRAGVHRVGRDPITRPATRHLHGEQDIRGLGLRIGESRVIGVRREMHIIENHRRKQVCPGTDGHDSGAAGGIKCIVQSEGQRKVADVIDREVQFRSHRG